MPNKVANEAFQIHSFRDTLSYRNMLKMFLPIGSLALCDVTKSPYIFIPIMVQTHFFLKQFIEKDDQQKRKRWTSLAYGEFNDPHH